MPYVFDDEHYEQSRKRAFDFCFEFEKSLKERSVTAIRTVFDRNHDELVTKGLPTHCIVALMRVPLRVKHYLPNYESAFMAGHALLLQRFGPDKTARLLVGLEYKKPIFLNE